MSALFTRYAGEVQRIRPIVGSHPPLRRDTEHFKPSHLADSVSGFHPPARRNLAVRPEPLLSRLPPHQPILGVAAGTLGVTAGLNCRI